MAAGVNLHIDHQWEVTPELVMNLMMEHTIERGEDISQCASLYSIGVDGAGLAVVADVVVVPSSVLSVGAFVTMVDTAEVVVVSTVTSKSIVPEALQAVRDSHNASIKNKDNSFFSFIESSQNADFRKEYSTKNLVCKEKTHLSHIISHFSTYIVRVMV